MNNLRKVSEEYELLPDCFYNSDQLFVIYKLAEYCHAKGLPEEDYHKLEEQVLKSGVMPLIGQLIGDLDEAKFKVNLEANKERQNRAADRDKEIRECYEIIMNEHIHITQTEAIAQLETDFEVSHNTVRKAIRPITQKVSHQKKYRDNWILWDYGPCLKEHTGNKSATYRELAKRHGMSESSIKRVLKSWAHLEDHLDHDWIPTGRTFTSGFQWGGRLGGLDQDYREAIKTMSEDEAKKEVASKYGFRVDQVEVLIERFPKELIVSDFYRDRDECPDDLVTRLAQRYRVSIEEVREALKSDLEYE